MTIALASDHGAYEMKIAIKAYLKDKGYVCTDFGSYSAERCDYPVFAARAGRAVADGRCDFGILICGTGLGMAIAANKIRGIRCVTCSDPVSASLSRRHNDANILTMGARIIGLELAKGIVDAFLGSHPEGGRHQNRVEMISALERGETLEGEQA